MRVDIRNALLLKVLQLLVNFRILPTWFGYYPNHAGNTCGYQCRVVGSVGLGKTHRTRKKNHYPSLVWMHQYLSNTWLSYLSPYLNIQRLWKSVSYAAWYKCHKSLKGHTDDLVEHLSVPSDDHLEHRSQRFVGMIVPETIFLKFY